MVILKEVEGRITFLEIELIIRIKSQFFEKMNKPIKKQIKMNKPINQARVIK